MTTLLLFSQWLNECSSHSVSDETKWYGNDLIDNIPVKEWLHYMYVYNDVK